MMFAIVVGTRPEFLKMVPIIKEFKKQKVNYKLFFTNQHFSKSMSETFFEEFNIYPNYEFGANYLDNKKDVKYWLLDLFEKFGFTAVIVHGDTSSALEAALATKEAQLPLIHVEAGLRSFDMKEPFPEEMNRTLIDSISDIMFCPTEDNYLNLPRVNFKMINNKAFIVGNTIIDLISSYDIKYQNNRKNILITIHRRENWSRLKEICNALKELSNDYENYNFVFVKHANPNITKIITKELKNSSIKLVEPMNHKEFVSFMSSCVLIISDSGGILEEASYLGIPVLSVRRTTERKEAFLNAMAYLAGVNYDSILRGGKFMLENISAYNKARELYDCPFGDGNASKKIVKNLKRIYGDKK